MSFLKKKRFWTDVSVEKMGVGFGVQLDGRGVKTPARADLIVPTRVAAKLIADEWDAVDGELDPSLMPATRWANVAIDRVGDKREDVVEMLAAYGATDLLCYRATHPASLIEKQAAVWDAPLAWSAEVLNAPLVVTQGIIPVDQANQSVANLRAEVDKMEPFTLSAFHDLVHISGSLVLSLALYHRQMDLDAVWNAAQVDEIWQNEVWGEDEDAMVAAEVKRETFAFAYELLDSVRLTH